MHYQNASTMSSSGVQYNDNVDEEQPLIRQRKGIGRPEFASLNLQHWYSHPFQRERWSIRNTRENTKHFFSSKVGHYSVLGLVTLDVLSMIAGKRQPYEANQHGIELTLKDFILNLFKCEQGKAGPNWDLALEILGSISLVFSCLFMVELIASIWAFGWRHVSSNACLRVHLLTNYSYFNSWFHCFDAFIVVAGFITDVVLHGFIEEVASLIVVMRLWRVFKIIEELSVGAQEQTDSLEKKISELRGDNELLRKEVSHLRRTLDKAGVHDEGHNTPPMPD